MDWLSSEDLKEEKVLTTSKLTITRQRSIYLSQIDLLTVSARPPVLRSSMLDSRLNVRDAANLLEGVNPGLGEQVRICWPGKPYPSQTNRLAHLRSRYCTKLLTRCPGHFGPIYSD
jgi:hypothetical protein